ncbi:terminase gpP N-terminus-related DNA-binding protein [Nocardia sp. NBC_01730]|uniref:terminase gpP N-terminus-related DNA-binding protein n=1 Tax=Nocardia sp. NBC_01730 TaxID=2975998 RepID=UPI003FA35D47
MWSKLARCTYAREIYGELDHQVRRKYTVAQIAGMIRVSRKTVYRYLDPDGRRQPCGSAGQ